MLSCLISGTFPHNIKLIHQPTKPVPAAGLSVHEIIIIGELGIKTSPSAIHPYREAPNEEREGAAENESQRRRSTITSSSFPSSLQIPRTIITQPPFLHRRSQLIHPLHSRSKLRIEYIHVHRATHRLFIHPLRNQSHYFTTPSNCIHRLLFVLCPPNLTSRQIDKIFSKTESIFPLPTWRFCSKMKIGALSNLRQPPVADLASTTPCSSTSK